LLALTSERYPLHCDMSDQRLVCGPHRFRLDVASASALALCCCAQMQNRENYRENQTERKVRKLLQGPQTGGRCGLNLLQPRLVDSRTAVIVPFNNRVIFVCSFNCAEFSCLLSEVAQTLDSISGIDLLVSAGGLCE
jgi:hypothetical protein